MVNQELSFNALKHNATNDPLGNIDTTIDPISRQLLAVSADLVQDNQSYLFSDLLDIDSMIEFNDLIMFAKSQLYINDIVTNMPQKIAYCFELSSSNGGTFTSGVWLVRTLNTELDPDNIVSLNSNTITINANGNYRIVAHAPAYAVNRHQCRLLLNNNLLRVGTTEYAYSGIGYQRSFVFHVGVLNANDTIKLEHRCETTVNTTGMGISAGFGDNIFAVVEIALL